MDKIYKKSPNMVFRRIGQECILVPMRQDAADLNSIYTLNEVSSFIWELFDGKNSLDGILKKIVAVFEVQEQIASDDLFSFVDKLCREGAVELVA